MNTLTNVATLATPQTILGTVYDLITVNPQIQTNYQTGTVRVQVSLVASGSLQQHSGTSPQQNAVVAKQYSLTPTSFDFPSIFQAAIQASGYEVI
jgi:hypothetical protein